MAGTGLARSAPDMKYRPRFAARCYTGLMQRLLRWLGLKLCLVHRRPLLPDDGRLRRRPAEYEFIEPGEAELLRRACDPRLDLPEACVREAFRHGGRCYAMTFRGDLVAYCWIAASGHVPFTDELEFLFDPAMAVCAWKMLTHPEHRGKRIQRYNIVHADSRTRERGHTHVVGYVGVENLASRAALARLPGIEYVGTVGAVRLFGRLCVFRTPGAQRARVGLRVRAAAAEPLESIVQSAE